MDLCPLDEGTLDFLSDSAYESPEELLSRLEDLLESGELSVTDVINYLADLGLTTNKGTIQ